MQEGVGPGNHKTAVAMVRAMDALWEDRGGHDPMVAAATIQRSRSPAPTSRKKNTKMATPVPKVALLSALITFRF